jgi:hypothetical protein
MQMVGGFFSVQPRAGAAAFDWMFFECPTPPKRQPLSAKPTYRVLAMPHLPPPDPEDRDCGDEWPFRAW